MNALNTVLLQPVALSIAGSDSGGNAGIQADLRAFHAFDVHGCTAITAVTAQNPAAVTDLEPVGPASLTRQLAAVFDVYSVRALKTGMLVNASLVHAVADVLSKHPDVPKVIDPVMVATSGRRLLDDAGVRALVQKILPLATLITPNLPEAAVLLGRAVEGGIHAGNAASELALRFGCAVLLKGGHDSAGVARDVFCTGDKLFSVYSPVVRKPLSLHGTGCALSAAITAALARGECLEDAVVLGKTYVYAAIRKGRRVGAQATVLGMPGRLRKTRRIRVIPRENA